MADRFSIQPTAAGRLSWPSSRELLFAELAPLRTDTTYHVLLRAGYRSQGGGAADLDHTWYFTTEGPLAVTDTNPAQAQGGVDPAAYLEVSFNHRMSAASLAGGFELSPPVPVQASLAPSDPFRVVIAPSGLLAAGASYTLTVSSAVKDADGNPLPKPVTVAFRTGPVKPLQGWLTCVAAPPDADPGAGGDLWMVDQNRLPRLLLPGPILAYAWAPGATELTVETSPRTWQDDLLDGGMTPIALTADAVLPLGGGRGFAYLDHGTLGLLSEDGTASVMAQNVSDLAVSPDGQRVAYAVSAGDATQLWMLSVELRSRNQLGVEAGAIAGLAWAPDSSRLAYQLVAATGGSIRVRLLAGTAATTVVSGAVSDPTWDADASHLYVLGAAGSPGIDRVYRLPTGSGPQTLTASTALPSPADVIVSAPAASPGGHQVAFVGSAARGVEIWVMNSDGTGLARLTGGPDFGYSCRAPSWTPPA